MNDYITYLHIDRNIRVYMYVRMHLWNVTMGCSSLKRISTIRCLHVKNIIMHLVRL